MSKRKHSKRKQTSKSLWNNPPRIPINQNSAFLFANAPNRPYIPLMTFIASPYNNGVVPDEYKVISTRLETLEKMNQAMQNEMRLSEDNNKNILQTQKALIQSQAREKEIERQKLQQEKRANKAEEELESIRNSKFYLGFD